MKVLFKKIWIEIAIIFLLSLTPLLWFGEQTIIVGHDNVFGLNPTNFLIGRLYTWIGFNLGQGQALIMGTIPTHLIDALPSFLGLPAYLTEKIVYVFWFFAIGISMYVLASVINKESRVFKMTAVILYQFNFFILSAWWIGERTKFSAYIAFPLIIAVLWLVYKEKLSISKAIAINILVFFIFNGGGLFGIPLFGGFFIGYVVFILFFSYLSFIRWKLKTVKNLFLVTILTVIGVILINSYYLFPAGSELIAQYKSGVVVHGGLSGLVDWASEISANTSFTNLFRLQGISDWYDNPSHPYAKNYLTNYLLIAASFIWLLLGFLALLRVKDREKKEFVLYCFIVFLLGIFFSAGTHPPFGYAYVYLLEHIPGFAIFRSPFFKFAPAIFLPLSLLIAFTLNSLTKNMRRVFFVCFIVAVLLYHYPYFLGNFFSWKEGYSTRNKIPNYIFNFGTWAENNIRDERILLLPGAVRDWQFDAYQWGYLSLQTLPTLITNKAILSNDNKLNIEEEVLIRELYSSIDNGNVEQMRKISSILQIKYILVREDVSFNQNWTHLGNPYRYEDLLQKTFGFSLEKSFDKWKVYKVSFEQMPKVFSVNTIESFDGPVSMLPGYISTTLNTPVYYINSDKNITKSSDISQIPTSKVLALPCVNCVGSGRQVIEFPRPMILPDSPFYSIVLLREKMKKKSLDTKARIYDDIGFSLKRFGEIKGLVVNSKFIKNSDFERYTATLNLLKEDFNSLQNLNDRLEISQDIYFYLRQEVVELRDLFRYAIYSKENLGESTKSVFDTITSINTIIKPYVEMVNDPSQKLYYFETGKKEKYSLLLNNNFQSYGSKFKVKFSIDNEAIKTVDLVGSNELIDLGKIVLSGGAHLLRLTLPTMENLAEDLRTDTFRLDMSEDTKCYTSKISNFDNKKTYQISFLIPKELNNRIYTYIKKDKKEGQKFDLLLKHDNVLVATQKMLISPDQEAKNAYFGICAENILKTDLSNSIRLRIDEVVYPKLLLIPEVRQHPTFKQVDTLLINPTKYVVHAKIDEPTVLVFSERFDPGWELSQFNETHFKAQGFANGWVITKPGEYNLTLEYEPQKQFYQGLAITTGMFLLCLVLIVRKGVKNEKN